MRKINLTRFTHSTRRVGRAVTTVGLVAAVSAGLLMAGAASASAVTGYSVSASGLALRAEPNTTSAVILRYAAGQQLDIECQRDDGANVGGSTIWDKITGTNGYVSDFYVNGTPFAQFDPRIPQCGAAPQPAPAPVTQPVASAPISTWHCAFPRCELYLNRTASEQFADYSYTPGGPPSSPWIAAWKLFSTAYRYIGSQYVQQGYCLAFQFSALPWETQGLWGYRC